MIFPCRSLSAMSIRPVVWSAPVTVFHWLKNR
jgi:hypothetical protein